MSDRAFSGLIEIAETPPTGMVSVRADLTDATIRQAFGTADLALPETGKIAGDAASVLWMSPDEVLVLSAADEAQSIATKLRDAFDAAHSLVVDISDARVMFRLTGDGAVIREVLAKLSPADLRPNVLPPGTLRRTRLAQVPAAFWFASENEAILICFRSVSDYVFDILSNAASEGTHVGYFAQNS